MCDGFGPVGWDETQTVCISCSDGIKNGRETAVDCGGPVCDGCTDGGACAAAADCASGQCEAGISTSCSNDVVDGVETAVDCGGATCKARCAIAVGCIIDSDCPSTKCDTATVLAGTDAAGPDLCLSRFGALARPARASVRARPPARGG